MWESLKGIMVNGALGRSLEYSMYSLGKILKAPFRIFKRRTLGHILGQTKGQKPLGPWLGLALDVASGSPFENPLGDLQSSP